MNPEHLPWACLGVLLVSLLYSCVGQAGASGYIAVMALFSFPAAALKPTALMLTVLVACLAAHQFWRAGHFSWNLFWPFAAASLPAAFLGGYLQLPPQTLKIVLGGILLYSAAAFLVRPPAESDPALPSRPVAFGVGAGLGLIAGLTGTGGGIFLTPLAIAMRWARTKTAAAVSAMFILTNSVAGLLGNLSSTTSLPALAWPLAGAAVVGGAVGSFLGSRWLAANTIKRLLALVLVVAGIKLLLG